MALAKLLTNLHKVSRAVSTWNFNQPCSMTSGFNIIFSSFDNTRFSIFSCSFFTATNIFHRQNNPNSFDDKKQNNCTADNVL